MNKKKENIIASLAPRVETILFAYGEPIADAHIAKILNAEKADIKQALNELEKTYGENRLVILKKDGMYQLATNPKYAECVETLLKSDMHEELTRAAVETLAVVAYQGPLTRSVVEYIRGVNSSFTLRNLLLRGLIERTENPKDARAPVYRISFDCLKYLGVKKTEELPRYKEHKAEIEKTFEESS